MSAAPLLRARELSGGYRGNGARPAIAGVSFEVPAGARVALLGPNGGGKSTLLRAIIGDLPWTAGELEVAGRAGSVPQTERSRLDFPIDALDVALMGTLSRLPWWRRPGRAERRVALEALERVGLRELAGRRFGELSGGQRQRVLVARALVQQARVLLLDEPFAGLDEPSAARLTALIDDLAAEGRALLVATHEVEQARGWDLVLCLNRRQVAFGAPGAVLSRAVLEATYGTELVDIDTEGAGARCVLPPHHH